MSENKKNVPKRRFKEFEDAEGWEQLKLVDGTSKIGDGLHGTPEFKDTGDVYFVNGNNLVNGNIEITKGTKLVSYVEQSDDDKTLDDNTILMSINGTIGNLAWYSGEKIMLGKSAAFIKIRDFNKKYIYYYLQTSAIHEYFFNNLTGTTIKNLGLKTIRETIIDVPSIGEQLKIGQFFEQLDNLITLHQRKLEKMKVLKKAYLTKMFPAEGERNTKLRFAGFTDDWEQRKVKDVCEISTGKSNTQDRIEDGIYPFYVRSPIIERSNRYLYDEEAVLTVGDGVGTGKVYHYVNGKYDLHQRVYRMFDFKNGALAKYFYHHFSNHFYDRAMAMTAKTSVDSVRYEMISEMSIEMPSEKEQAKIIDYLDNLDNLITIYQRKLEKLQNIKKAYLNEMFIQRGA